MSIEEFNKADDKLQANICLIKGDEIEEKILETISEQKFNQIFSKFDLDGDGLISYKDF